MIRDEYIFLQRCKACDGIISDEFLLLFKFDEDLELCENCFDESLLE